MGSLCERNQSGQAAVEAAIVLPLFVFLILGILQLGLMHQARLLTKYAAYKAVRAGALNSAKVDVMEKAALAVLLPLLSVPSGVQNRAHIPPVGSAAEFQQKWQDLQGNQIPGTSLKHAEVTICGPTRGDVGGAGPELDFDDPRNTAPSGWKESHRTKLRVQVTFNYRMIIPFADWVIYQSTRGRKMTSVLRMQGETPEGDGSPERTDSLLEAAAAQRIFISPIRATYTMRMQSNFFLNRAALPGSNECVFPFAY
ncbi:TadE/TadG family type IV pilus assembly protein [Myxococcus sp. AM010]|uniref:TadE/TadG family type IV pilus assembly protein n=1 Tax=Myxococcus sp. AM010 TaxID=2745138 RepID=UPI001595AD57|nr:TadE/TadG family type IV pilus assembly protein [Myxococcus sp. AM010]NVJ18387.1 pilus assembly protein [Myxococcus sp. AM010]